jgi:hypothetical protein
MKSAKAAKATKAAKAVTSKIGALYRATEKVNTMDGTQLAALVLRTGIAGQMAHLKAVTGRDLMAPKPQPQKTAKPKLTPKQFAARAVALYAKDKKVSEIAVALGYERGHGQNRVCNALIRAGVYKGSRKASVKAAATA